MRYRVLLIEDAEESKEIVLRSLGNSFDVTWATALRQAQVHLQEGAFDLILLDVGLPDGDGFQFYSTLKNDDKYKNIPIIFLTARSSDADKVLGLSLGAEDYVVKPFSSPELKARVEMRIKKNLEKQGQDQVIKNEFFELSLAEQRAFVLNEGKRENLELTTLEFKIFVVLIKNEERVFSRESLLKKVWGENTFLTDRCIDTHIYSLRKKLGPLANCIKSVYGQGYRFSSQIAPQSDKSAA